MTTDCILIHYHEISIKGDNRRWFEKIFARNIRKQLKGLPFSSVDVNAARVFIFGIDVNLWTEYSEKLKCVMSLVNATLMVRSEPDMDIFKSIAEKLVQGRQFETFRVSSKRQYKNFPLTSQQINIELGAHIQKLTRAQVKLKSPELNIHLELVKGKSYMGVDRVVGFGGLPVGTGEKAVSLISSGIDSPVSSFELLKRGVDITYVHFHSAPATSRQSIKNVERLLEVLADYQMKCQLFHIPLLEIQETIMATAPSKLWVILFRRAMMRLAETIADKIGANALITGENVGQVASQTLSNMRAAADAVNIPILRPLAGMNKEDIIVRAREIRTYEISIEPYQDCCSYFVPIHPETHADLEEVRRDEAKLNMTGLYKKAMASAEEILIVAK